MKPEWMPPPPESFTILSRLQSGTEEVVRLDEAVAYAFAAVEAYKTSLKSHGKYGCHCDLEEGQKPDDCVLNLNRPQDCVYAQRLLREGKDQSSCEYWKPIRLDGGDDDAA